MAGELGIQASNITAALISSSAVTIKGKDKQDTVNNAVSIYGMVLTELLKRSREGTLYKEP